MNKQTEEALKMSIEAMYDAGFFIDGDVGYPIFFEKAIKACKEALAEAENPELVAVQYLYRADPDNPEMIPLYTHPATWKSLSDDDMKNLIRKSGIPKNYDYEILAFARAIESKLKEKNFDSLSS